MATRKAQGQISVFVSRKDSKLYVRRNFEPLFDVPVTIAPSDRPLGTHVFTAQVDKERRQPAALVSRLLAGAGKVSRAGRRGRTFDTSPQGRCGVEGNAKHRTVRPKRWIA